MNFTKRTEPVIFLLTKSLVRRTVPRGRNEGLVTSSRAQLRERPPHVAMREFPWVACPASCDTPAGGALFDC